MNGVDREKNVAVVVTVEERRRLKLLAAIEGKTVSSYIRDVLLENTRLADDSFFASAVHRNEHIIQTADR